MIIRKKQNRRKPQPLSVKRSALNRRRVKKDRRMVRDSFAILGFIAVFGSIALVTWVAGKMADPATLPIRSVKVEGDFNYLSTATLQALVVEKVDGGFFTVKVGEIRNAVLSAPWVKEVTVRKLWPDTLYLKIQEQSAVTRWGDTGFLNQKGELFEPEDISRPQGLIRLNGPNGTHKKVFEKYKKLMGLLSPYNRSVAWVDLNDRRGWSFGIKNGPSIVIGNKEVDERLWKYVSSVEALIGDEIERVAQVDLRYSNGFTIRQHAQSESGGT